MELEYLKRQELENLKENLEKHLGYLKDLERKLGYTSYPLDRVRLEEDIKSQKEAIKNYKQEYARLEAELLNVSSNAIEATPVNVISNTQKNLNEQNMVDIGIIVALREEFRELMKQIPASHKAIKDSQTGVYDYLFEWPIENNIAYCCAATMVGAMGPSKAALATERFISRRQPKTIVMLGIAAGLNQDVKLGDVVLVTDINMYLERSKVVDAEKDETFELQAGGSYYRCSENLVQSALNLEFAHRNLYKQWQSQSKTELTNEISSEELNRILNNNYLREQPDFIDGSLASGPVVGAAQEFIKWLKKIGRNYLALEMESGGMLSSVYGHSDPKSTLILRGISDFGDSRKQELDATGKGAIRRYAMNNVTRLLWKLLEAEILPRK